MSRQVQLVGKPLVLAVGTFARFAVIADDRDEAKRLAISEATRAGWRVRDVAYATAQSPDEYLVELQVER